MAPAHPTNDFLKWCHNTYSNTLDHANLSSNLMFTDTQPWGLDSNWVEDYVGEIHTTGGRVVANERACYIMMFHH
jgi:hypothetical protein